MNRTKEKLQKEIILVDENNQIVGYSEKREAHEKGLLHRAFSIFVMNENEELMLQQRALHKYHSAGLWANTCCSHPLKGEETENTIHERLQFEMGFDCDLQPLFKFIYRAEFENDLTEHELDQVYLGSFEGSPNPNPEEVMDWKWMNMETLKSELEENPDDYVYWLKAAFDAFYDACLRPENP